MSEDQRKQYEEAAKRKFDAIGRPDDGNEMRAFISGCSHAHSKIEEAEREAHNMALDEVDIALGRIFDGVLPELHEKICEELKKLRK